MASSGEQPGGLSVAVTGPTGDIGRAYVAALEREPRVARVVGMARSPFDPAELGWTKTEYVQGDILDRASVDRVVDGADVVVHLAFVIMGTDADTRTINVDGSRNVFEATATSGAKRLLYTSSVAAYGFHRDNPERLTEDHPPRGLDAIPYSVQKRELEDVLWRVLDGSDVAVFVFRPPVVAGPTALSMVDEIPAVLRRSPTWLPVLPDPGVAMQMIHEDDMASALVAATLGVGTPGVYNVAGPGELTLTDLANAFGWKAVRVPPAAGRFAAAVVTRVPFLPPKLDWVNALRGSTLMDTEKAQRELGWRPKHEAKETLAQLVDSAREAGLLKEP